MKHIPVLLLLTLLFTGCASTDSRSEFFNTITFSTLETFSYKHTLISGMDFRDSEELFLEELSEQTLVSAMKTRGFEQVDGQESDFYIVTKWRKAVSSYPDMFDHIDSPMDSMNRRDNPSYRFASRLHLIVEVYEASTGNLFWRKDLPNIFDAVQFTEERVVDSLRRAIKNFPERVEKDPSLPDIG